MSLAALGLRVMQLAVCGGADMLEPCAFHARIQDSHASASSTGIDQCNDSARQSSFPDQEPNTVVPHNLRAVLQIWNSR